MGRKRRCYSGIGGQAVLEGIMMKNNTRYSVAVRKPNGEIDVEIGEYAGILGKSAVTKVPFIRGIFSFVDSLRLGTKCLNHSAAFFAEEETAEESAADKMLNKVFKDKAESILMALTMVVAVVFAVGIFMVLPYILSSYLERFVRNESLLAIIEGLIRILIFVMYVLLISLMKDIRRVYMYHGAEHKCINCIERGRELTVENVMKSSKQHRRCGTSFLLFVMLVSVILFFFIRVDNMALKILLRILLIPVIAGIAYEMIRLAGRTDNWLVRTVSAPGLWLQGLTTKEPDEGMVEVAIKAVEAVFDWKAYLRENFGYEDEQESEGYVGEDEYSEGYTGESGYSEEAVGEDGYSEEEYAVEKGRPEEAYFAEKGKPEEAYFAEKGKPEEEYLVEKGYPEEKAAIEEGNIEKEYAGELRPEGEQSPKVGTRRKTVRKKIESDEKQQKAIQGEVKQERVKREKVKQGDAKPDKIIQGEVKQERVKREKVKQGEAKPDKAIQVEVKQERVKREKVKQGEAKQDKVIQGEVKQERVKREKAKQGEAKPDKVKQEKVKREKINQQKVKPEPERLKVVELGIEDEDEPSFIGSDSIE